MINCLPVRDFFYHQYFLGIRTYILPWHSHLQYILVYALVGEIKVIYLFIYFIFP